MDSADFPPPEPYRQVKNPRMGEPIWHQLPAVWQAVRKGPGVQVAISVAEARLYLDDVSNRCPDTRNGEQA
ncbi:MAG: hypothetical protein NVS3B25_25110 [Hymenobacter sp.]